MRNAQYTMELRAEMGDEQKAIRYFDGRYAIRYPPSAIRHPPSAIVHCGSNMEELNMPLYTISGEVGQVGQTLSTGSWRTKLPPIPMTLVHVAATGTADDAGLALQVQDDGTDILGSAIDLALTATNGTWISKHFGGTNDPVEIAGSSVIEVDLASAAADTRVQFVLTLLY